MSPEGKQKNVTYSNELLNRYQVLFIWVLKDDLNYKLNKYRKVGGTIRRTRI